MTQVSTKPDFYNPSYLLRKVLTVQSVSPCSSEHHSHFVHENLEIGAPSKQDFPA